MYLGFFDPGSRMAELTRDFKDVPVREIFQAIAWPSDFRRS